LRKIRNKARMKRLAYMNTFMQRKHVLQKKKAYLAVLERDTDEIAVRQCEIDCGVVDPKWHRSHTRTSTHQQSDAEKNDMHDD
jgi:hypothetical protein